MNIRIVLSLFCFTSFQTAFADSELERLAASYASAVERATEPIRRDYENQLRKLLDRQTRAGNLNAALATRTTLERLTGKAEVSLGEAKPTNAGKAIELFFVDKTWQAPKGTKFTFKKGGSCIREFENQRTLLKWRAHGSETVEVMGTAPVDNRFFRFVSSSEAYLGDSENEIKTRLEPK